MSYWDDSKAYWDDTGGTSSGEQDYEGYVPDQPSRPSRSGRKSNTRQQSSPSPSSTKSERPAEYAWSLKPGDKIIHDGEEKTVDRVVNRSSGGCLGTSTIYFKGGGKSEGAQEREVSPVAGSVFELVRKALGKD